MRTDRAQTEVGADAVEEEAVVGVLESENERGGRGDADGVELRLVLGDELVLGNSRGE